MRRVAELRQVGVELRNARELDVLPLGTIVLASSYPEPRYFRRGSLGWLACSATGDTRRHAELVVELPGWPLALPSSDIRRPAFVVELPDEIVPARRTARERTA